MHQLFLISVLLLVFNNFFFAFLIENLDAVKVSSVMPLNTCSGGSNDASARRTPSQAADPTEEL